MIFVIIPIEIPPLLQNKYSNQSKERIQFYQL